MKKLFTLIFIFLTGILCFSCNMGEEEEAKLLVQNGCERQIYVALTAQDKTTNPTEDEYVKINSGMVYTFSGFDTESFKLWFKEYDETLWNFEEFDNTGSYIRVKVRWDAGRGGCYVAQ